MTIDEEIGGGKERGEEFAKHHPLPRTGGQAGWVRRNPLAFDWLYIVCGTLFVLLVLGYPLAAWIWAGEVFTPPIWLPAGFAAALLIVAGSFVWKLRARSVAAIQAAYEIVDTAIAGRPRLTGYEETELSALENKVFRYVELARTREGQIQAQRSQLQTLLSDISHQTKTPLSSIRLYAELLEEIPELNEEAHQYAAQVKAQAVKLDWLIGSLIKMSRLETGMIALQTAVSPLIPTISQAVSQVYAAAERKSIPIAIDCDPEIQVRHDSKWTGEALFNLLENAVKYSADGKGIRISVQAGEMFTRIDVADQGMGIAEQEWNEIFKRFYRSKDAAQYEGVGIGLYLAREIIAAQGGYIKVSSRLSEGSVFSVFLPIP
ncbi:sensor histidine kinase [Paenibacillus rubinfantis]|uniref:sensor histidine kinase n=1 Tax=Paenibacillus rubinfantis TaxID=1720296 RepID=UPI0009EB6F58|nr:HAMP domain-containing sensor histidine kinase [Paenibacillus rubinfantis]